MNGKIAGLLSLFFASLFAVPTFAQCKNPQDRACVSLQYILYASETDFLEFSGSTPLESRDRKVTRPNPDLSVGAIHVPCHSDFWLSSNVAVYMCSAEVPAQEAEEWYAKTMKNLHELQYLWQFKSESAGADHYVDAGEPGCEVAEMATTSYGGHPVEDPYIVAGPYLGQCPLHLQTVRQADGMTKISFWLNSSVNLAKNPGPLQRSPELSASAKSESARPRSASVPGSTPASTRQPASATADNLRSEPAVESSAEDSSKTYAGCDELCQGIKKVLENRASSFRELGARSGSSTNSRSNSFGDTVKLTGAASCLIRGEPSASGRSSAKNQPVPGANFVPVSIRDTQATSSGAPERPAAQYVCYWPRDSEAAGESEFLGLVGLLRALIPSGWVTQQSIEADELSGAQMTVWSARDSKNRVAVGLYRSGRSVGLHISAGE